MRLLEASHGQNVVDRIGGPVKHAVYFHVPTKFSSNLNSNLKIYYSEMWKMKQ